MDEKQKERPNAAYKLTEVNQNADELKFRYSREERIAKAPRAVQEIYSTKKESKFSFFGPLIGGKGRSLLFGSIILICVMLLILSIVDPLGGYDIDGNRIAIEAVKYEGTIIVVLKKVIKDNYRSVYTGTVEIGASPEISPANSDEETTPPLFLHRIYFTNEKTEEYRFSLPFEAESILMVLQTEKNTLSMKIKVN